MTAEDFVTVTYRPGPPAWGHRVLLYAETARQFGIEPGYVITTSDELLRLLEANALVGIAKCDADLARKEQTISVTTDRDQTIGSAVYLTEREAELFDGTLKPCNPPVGEPLAEPRYSYCGDWKPGAADGLDWANLPPNVDDRLLDHADRPRPRVYPVPSDDDADLELLSMANELGKFCLELGGHAVPHLQFAFERGIDREWFTLVDIAPIAEYPNRMFRCFRLTVEGRVRLTELKGKKKT